MKPHDGSRCRELLEQLNLYIDGELEPRRRRSLMNHLRKCQCCEEFVESLRRTVHLCEEAGRSRMPAAVRARARARIKELMGETM